MLLEKIYYGVLLVSILQLYKETLNEEPNWLDQIVEGGIISKLRWNGASNINPKAEQIKTDNQTLQQNDDLQNNENDDLEESKPDLLTKEEENKPLPDIKRCGCQTSTDQVVPWWIIYKLPRDKDWNPDGFSYYYADQSSQKLVRQPNSLNDQETSPLLKTLQLSQALDGFLIWNNQPNERTDNRSKAHSKGFLGYNLSDQNAFFVQHSAPQFPTIDQSTFSYKLGKNLEVYGQHFFCFSAPMAIVEQIAEVLNFINIPVIYSKFLHVMNEYPHLSKLHFKTDEFLTIKNDPVKLVQTSIPKGAYHHQLKLDFEFLEELHIFATDKKCDKHFYGGIIAFGLQTPLITETWIRGKIETNENQMYPIQINNRVQIEDISFKSTREHSKIAISNDEQKFAVCFSDLNNQLSNNRGGLALCFKNIQIWQQFRGMFVELTHKWKEDQIPPENT